MDSHEYMPNRNITDIILPIQYNYLFQEPPKQVIEYLKTIPREEVFRIVLNITNFTKESEWKEQLDSLPLSYHLRLKCRLMMVPHELESPKAVYVLYTPLTGLKLLKYLFTIPADEHHLVASEWRLNMLKAITLVNSEIIREGVPNNKSSFSLFYKSVMHYRYELDDRIILFPALYRAMCLLDLLEDKHDELWQNLCTELTKRLKCDSIRDYLRRRIDLLQNLDIKPKKKNQIFRVKQNNEDLREEAISYIETIDLDANKDYTAFKKRPFVQIQEGEFAVIRDSFVANIIYEKLKFGLLDCYKKTINDVVKVFFGRFDTDYIEKHLFVRVLKYSFISHKLQRYICLSEDECKARIKQLRKLNLGKFHKNDVDGLMDGYIRHNNKILLIECKGKIIGNDILSSETLLYDNISKSIVEKEGVAQLKKVCERIIDRNGVWDNDIPQYYTIYPLLIMDNIGFSANGFNQYIIESTKDFVKLQKPVFPFTVLDMDTFILISELIRSKKLNIFREIENYHKHINWHNGDDQNISFAIYLRYKYKTSLPKEVLRWIQNLYK